MKVLLISAFGEGSHESGANRLRKLALGLRESGCSVDWIGPGGARGEGKLAKLTSIFSIIAGAIHWARKERDGWMLVSLPPPWLLPVAMALGVFWSRRLVLDFRDPLLNQQINPRGPIYRLLIGGMQNLAIRRCRLVVTAARRIGNYLQTAGKPVCVVLGGTDAAEVAEIEGRKGKRDKNLIVYGGSFYGSRTPGPLFEALSAYGGSLRLELYVSFNDPRDRMEAQAQVSKLGLDGRVVIREPVSRARFLDALSIAGAGLVITHTAGSDYAIPGKIFDYLTAGVFPWIVTTDRGLTEFLDEFRVEALVTQSWKKDDLLSSLAELEARLLSAKADEKIDARLHSSSQSAGLVDALKAL